MNLDNKDLEPRELFVGLSAPHSKTKIGSFIIRLAEAEGRKPWNPVSWFNLFFASHIFILHPRYMERDFYLVNEAAGTMVRWVSEPNFKVHSQILKLYKFIFPHYIYKNIKLYGERHSGTPYAMLENIGIGLVRIVRLFTGKRITNPFSDGDISQKCSELCFRAVLDNVPGFDFEGFIKTLNEKGYECPTDLDLLGVRDSYKALEYLSELEICERMDVELFEGKKHG